MPQNTARTAAHEWTVKPMDKLQFVYTSDMKPVAHARWIEYPLCLGYVGAYSEDHIVCSNCKSVWSIIDNDTERFDYCPACGAKLDGERRESDEQ